MEWSELKKIPNQITLIRIIAIPFLWVLAILNLKLPFFILLLIAALTDTLDGYFARKLKQTSKFGEWFDSLADNLISACIIFWFYLFIRKE